jgi:hypothetical protein
MGDASQVNAESLAEAFDQMLDEEEAQAVSAPVAVAQHQFTLGQTVYSAHILRLTPNTKLNADHKGQVIMRYQPAKDSLLVTWYKWGYASSDVIHDWLHASQIPSLTILSPEECSKRFGGLPPTYGKD